MAKTQPNAYNVLPPQKLSISKKNKQWRESCVDYIIGAGGNMFLHTGNESRHEMLVNENLYNSVFDENDLKYVTNPFKQLDSFPARMKEINIIRPKIDLLVGEEIMRPFNFMVTRTSDGATSEIQELKKQKLFDYMLAVIMSKMDDERAQEFQEKLQTGEILPPEQIERYFEKDYKDIAEITAKRALDYFRKKADIDHEFVDCFKDLLIKGKSVIYTGIENGIPVIRHVAPVHFGYDYSPDLNYIDEARWCVEHLRLPHTEVYDMLYDKMSNKDLDKLLELTNNGGMPHNLGDRKSGFDYNHITWHSYNPIDGPSASMNGLVDLYHVCWKSFRKLGFLTILGESGEPETIEVDETYQATGEELFLEWDWVIEVWEGWRIGADIYVGVQPLEYQWISVDNPNATKLPYTGVVVNKSLVQLMKPLQYLYMILWYRIELAVSRDKGKVLTMDIGQIPKSQGIDIYKWAHMLSAIGINLINPYDEGYIDKHGQMSQFNQLSALDLTMGQSITSYIELMVKIEEMIGEISGVSKQREGAIQQREAVGNVNRSLQQSSTITEPLFYIHQQLKRRSLQMLIDVVKYTWSKNDKNYIHYILDDGTRSFLEVQENCLYEDFDIFVTNSSEDFANLQLLETLFQPAMQNGTRLSDIASIMTMKNIDQIKDKLRELEQEADERLQQQQQQEAANNERLAQIQQEAEAQKQAIEQAKLELERYKVDSTNQTKIMVAEIQAYNRQQEFDQNNNGIPDPMEIADLSLRQLTQGATEQDLKEKNKLKEREIETKEQEAKDKRNIESRKLDLERDKLRITKQIEELKAANKLAVERLKIKNPTNAEAARK